MDKNRLWVIGSVVVMVAVVALGWVLGIQPQLSAATEANSQRATVAQTNAAQEASLAKLKEDYKSIGKLNEQLAALDESVPSGTDAPDYVNQLDALAAASQVTLKGLTVADAQAYTPVAPVAPAAPAASGDAAATPTPTEAPALVAAPGSPPVTNAKITAENFASLAVQITVSGPYTNVLNFVNGLQTGKRLFLVTGLATTAVADSPGVVDGTISGLIYSIVTPTTPSVVGAG
jgi:Tfp pilus assembly protein PilO